MEDKKVINVKDVKDEKELHILLKDSLGFPDFYGNNWDAFWDAITGLVELPPIIEFDGWDKLLINCPYGAIMVKEIFDELNEKYPKLKVEVIYK